MGKAIKEYSLITFGGFLIAVAVFFFMIPSNTAVGSITGLSVMISHVTPLPVSVLLFGFNMILLIIGFVFLGKEFGGKTVYVSILMPIFQYIFEICFPNFQSLSNDALIDTISYLLIVSIGQAILFHHNASSGGMDIIAKMLHKFAHFDLGQAMTIGGMCIAVSGILVYEPKFVVLGILATYANGVILDNFINGFNRRKRVCILSSKHEEVQEFIVNKLNRGVTLYQAMGGFNKEEKVEVVTILARSEYATLMNYLQEIDENAFVTVSTVNEVIGKWNRNQRKKG